MIVVVCHGMKGLYIYCKIFLYFLLRNADEKLLPLVKKRSKCYYNNISQMNRYAPCAEMRKHEPER